MWGKVHGVGIVILLSWWLRVVAAGAPKCSSVGHVGHYVGFCPSVAILPGVGMCLPMKLSISGFVLE